MVSRPAESHLALVVDDERALAGMVATYLSRAGLRTDQVHTGPDAVTRARADDPDVVILDLGLPGMDGVEVCRVIRSFSDCYILMLTARNDEADKLVGLSAGADDYIVKPFSIREVVARVQSVLRRPRSGSPLGVPVPRGVAPPFQKGDICVDFEGREVLREGLPVPLTRTEFDILSALAARPQKVLTRRDILDEVWDKAWVGDEHVIDVHVAHIRQKLQEDPGNRRYIVTIRGVGYRMGTG
jgi:DNA-binding response OmpR family regulator